MVTTPPRAAPLGSGPALPVRLPLARFDGGHTHDRFLTDVLGRHVEWVPVCPEVELGLGVPGPRCASWGHPRRPGSCRRRPTRILPRGWSGTRGLFAEALVTALPALPAEEVRLHDPALLMEAYVVRTTRGRRANVLTHMTGYFTRELGTDERLELVEVTIATICMTFLPAFAVCCPPHPFWQPAAKGEHHGALRERPCPHSLPRGRLRLPAAHPSRRGPELDHRLHVGPGAVQRDHGIPGRVPLHHRRSAQRA